MNNYLVICVRQVDVLPVNHILHSRHFRAGSSLSGCLPSSNNALKSGGDSPFFERFLVCLRAYTCMHTEVSQSRLEQ